MSGQIVESFVDNGSQGVECSIGLVGGFIEYGTQVDMRVYKSVVVSWCECMYVVDS